MSTFSVLVSVYKNDDPVFLKLALESISVQQTVLPDEIVIVLDGPVSNAINETINEFSKQVAENLPVIIVPLETNRGLGLALKEGSLRCSGDYIVRMDADDLSVRDRISISARFAEAHPNVDAFGGYIAEFNEHIGDIEQIRTVPLDCRGIAKMGKRRNPMNHVTVCMKKKSLFAVGNYEHLIYLEDYYLWLKMLANGMDLMNIPEVLVNVRVGNGFVSKRNSRERIEGWDYLQRYLRGNKMITLWEALANMLMIRAFVYTPSLLKAGLYKYVLRK